MNRWKETLAKTGLSTTALVVCTLAAVAIVGECTDFRADAKKAAAPTVAPPTKIEQKAETKILPCRDVVAIEPRPWDRERLAEKYRRPDLAPKPARVDAALARDFEAGMTNLHPAEILGERQLPKLPNGGTALLTLEPDGRSEITIIEAPPKLFEWRATYEAGVLYGMGTSSGTGDTRGRAWAAVEPFRFARLHLRAEAGVDIRNGTTDGYAMAGIVWRSR